MATAQSDVSTASNDVPTANNETYMANNNTYTVNNDTELDDDDIGATGREDDNDNDPMKLYEELRKQGSFDQEVSNIIILSCCIVSHPLFSTNESMLTGAKITVPKTFDNASQRGRG